MANETELQNLPPSKRLRIASMMSYIAAQEVDNGRSPDSVTAASMAVEDFRLALRIMNGRAMSPLEYRTISFGILGERDSVESEQLYTLPEKAPIGIIKAGPMTLNSLTSTIETPYMSPGIVKLTTPQVRLAAITMRNAGSIVPYYLAIDTLWPDAQEGGDLVNRLKVHLSHLRTKTGDPKLSKLVSRHFQSVRGAGVRFME